MPLVRSARAVVQEIVSRRRVSQASDDVIDGERELFFGGKAVVRFGAHIRGANGIRGYWLSAALSVRAHNRAAVGALELKLAEQRFDAFLEDIVVGDRFGDMQVAHFLSLCSAEKG